MEMGNTEHGAETEGPGVSEIKLVDLGKGWNRSHGAGGNQDTRLEEGRRRREGRGPGDGSDLKPSAWY